MISKQDDTKDILDNEPSQNQRSNRRFTIFLVIALIVILIGIQASRTIPEIMTASDYRNAMTFFDDGRYDEARTAFLSLGEYADSKYYVLQCQYYLAYQSAERLFIQGNYKDARELFSQLGSTDFLDTWERVNECTYRIAQETLISGDREEAYNLFRALEDYRDSAQQMEACLLPYPDSGVLYQNALYQSTSVVLDFHTSPDVSPLYTKIYAEDTFVAALFLFGEEPIRITLPAGSYTIKAAQGTLWFGEEQLFGSEGDYYLMLFNDSDSVLLNDNTSYAITSSYESNGSIVNQPIDRESF